MVGRSAKVDTSIKSTDVAVGSMGSLKVTINGVVGEAAAPMLAGTVETIVGSARQHGGCETQQAAASSQMRQPGR